MGVAEATMPELVVRDGGAAEESARCTWRLEGKRVKAL